MGLRVLTVDNLPLIKVSMTVMSDRWSNAIERRLSANPDIPRESTIPNRSEAEA
jgi:hypothetical protein